MTRKTCFSLLPIKFHFEGLYLTSQWRYLPDILCVDSWLGMFCECNLISHASAFSIRPHPLKVVTLIICALNIFSFFKHLPIFF